MLNAASVTEESMLFFWRRSCSCAAGRMIPKIIARTSRTANRAGARTFKYSLVITDTTIGFMGRDFLKTIEDLVSCRCHVREDPTGSRRDYHLKIIPLQ